MLHHFTPSEQKDLITLAYLYPTWKPNFFTFLNPLISWKALPLQPNQPLFYVSILIRGNSSKILPLQPILTWQFCSGGNSSKFLLSQSIPTGNFCSGEGGNSSKLLPLIPTHSFIKRINKNEWNNCREVINWEEWWNKGTDQDLPVFIFSLKISAKK